MSKERLEQLRQKKRLVELRAKRDALQTTLPPEHVTEDIMSEDPSYGQALNEKTSGLVQGLKDLPGNLATAGRKIVSDPRQYLPQAAKSLVMEGLPFTEVLQGTGVDLAASAGAIFDPSESVSDRRRRYTDRLEQEKATVDPDIRAAASLGGFVSPGKAITAGTSMVEAGMSSLGRGESTNEALAASTIAGGMAAMPKAIQGTASAVTNPNMIKAVGKAPGRFLNRKKDQTLERYYEDPEAVKNPTPLREVVEDIADLGDTHRKNLEVAQTDVRNAEGRVQKAKEDYLFNKSQEQAAIDTKNQQAQLDYEAKSQAAKQELQNAQSGLQEAQDAFKMRKRELEEQVRNVPEEAVTATKDAIDVQRKGVDKLSMEQAATMDAAGITFDITEVKAALNAAIARKALPAKKDAKIPDANLSEVRALAEGLADTATATQLLALRQKLSDLGFKKEKGAPGSVSAYHKINELFDDPTLGLGPEYAPSRANLANEVTFRKEVKKGIETNPASKLAKIGGKNDAGVVNLVERLDTKGAIRVAMADYLKAKGELSSGRHTTPEAIAEATQKVEAAKARLQEIQKPTLEKLPQEDLPDFAAQQNMSDLRATEQMAKDVSKQFPYDKASAQNLVESNYVRPRERIGKQDELDRVAVEMGDPNLRQKVEDIGHHKEMTSETASDNRFINATAKMGRVGAGALVGSMVGGPIGSLIGAGVGLASPMVAAGLPIDVARGINKAVSKMKDTTAAKVLNSAFENGGVKSVQVTHFLLQQSNPEYRQAAMEDTED